MKVMCHSSVGGTNIRRDVASVGHGVHILVGTVGRVSDLINRRALRTDTIMTICLYGADPSHSGKESLAKDSMERSMV